MIKTLKKIFWALVIIYTGLSTVFGTTPIWDMVGYSVFGLILGVTWIILVK